MTAKSKIPTTIHNTQLLVSMSNRRGKKLGSTSQAYSSHSEKAESTSKAIKGKMSKGHSSQSRPVKGKPIEIPVEDPDKPSTDLRRKPKGIIRWVKYLPGRVRRFWWILNPPLTEDELEGKEELRKLISRTKLVKREAHKYEKLASGKLAQLGERELLNSPSPDKPKRLKLVKWDVAAWDELFTKIILSMRTDPKHLPAYVKISELARDPLYADEMLPTLGHFTKWECDEAGVRLIIFRHGLDGLPPFVNTETMWKRCPENKPPLTVPVGFGDNSSAHFIDPAEYPHLLVTGGTGWGKSNMINQLICFWLWRGIKPADLQLVMFDLKKGMEFASYENLPHLYKDDVIKTGIIEDLEGVLPALHRMQEIRDQRMEQIKRAGYKNFQEFNWGSKPEKRLPAIFLVFDEWAKIRLSRSGFGPRALASTTAKLAKETVISILRKGAGASNEKLTEIQTEFGNQILKLRQSRHFGLEAEEMLAEFTNLARAAGMYVILSTQHPSREVLTGLIMINFPTRIVLNSSVGGSMAALGTQSAFRLEYKGRAILLDRGEEIKIQTPMISQADINSIVHSAITGEAMSDLGKMVGTGIEEVLIYSLHNLDGVLDIQKLYSIFKSKGVRRDWVMNSLKALDGKEINLSGVTYRVKSPGYHVARRLIRVQTPIESLVNSPVPNSNLTSQEPEKDI